MPRALLLINPRARSGATLAKQLWDQLKEYGIDPVGEFSPNRKVEDFRHLLLQFREHIDLVIAAGGDGTLSSVVRLMKEEGVELPLGALPLGTANNFVRNLGIAGDVPSALKVIAEGHRKKVDLAAVNGFYFLNSSGVGFSTDINRRLSPFWKKFTGRFSYFVSGLLSFSMLHRFSVELLMRRAHHRTKTYQLTICNGKYYGGAVAVAEDASFHDSSFHIRSVEFSSLWQAIRHLPSFLKGVELPEQGLKIYRTDRVIVRTRKRRLVDVDGEILTETPALYELFPEDLEVFVPKKPLDV